MEFSWLKTYSYLEHVHLTLWASSPVKWASKFWKVETLKQLSFYRFLDQEAGPQKLISEMSVNIYPEKSLQIISPTKDAFSPSDYFAIQSGIANEIWRE